MAIVHRLTDSDATLVADFTSSGLYCRADTWSISSAGDGLLSSTFTVVALGDDETIAEAIQPVSELIEQNRLYWTSNSYRAPVWYEYSADGESAPKRSLVREIELVPSPQGVFGPTLGKGVAFFDIAIVYQENWEDRSGTVLISSVSHSTLGGKSTINPISGSLPARIMIAQFSGGTSGQPLVKIWAGIRPFGNGVSSFQPVWELESGTLGTDASVTTDTDAGPGGSNNTIQISFATATMAQRISMTVDDACGDNNFSHFAGRYNVLLRCRLSSSGEATVQMKSGYGSVLAPAGYKSVTWTSYKYVSLGEITIPPMGNYVDTWVDNKIFRTFAVSVWAERNSGTPSLLMDCLVLIPADHMIYCSGASVADGKYTNFYVFEDGGHQAISLDSSGNPNAGLQAGFRNWAVPILGGAFVCAAERANSQVRSDNVTVYMAVIHQHRHLND